MSESRPENEYRENYIDSLRKELVDVVHKHMTPVAMQYHYAATPLEGNIKWRPMVLILGNYSSGKSTLINELLGAEIQTTGQAPTDDSFTVITSDKSQDSTGLVHVAEERDGKALLNDEQFPFSSLRRHGGRFAAHFRLKVVNSPVLENLAIIDTPGMVDSVSEKDRGYDYQEVVGDLAQIADLILVLFDPHKAGTIRETYESLRKTLPKATYEDRVLFVLNRVDECNSLNDLLRVYGTLCWNLSQMTGRKDIPPIHMTYSPVAGILGEGREFLKYLQNQRETLKQNILAAPKHRLDHLTTYIEEHGERLCHMLEALQKYGEKRRGMMFRLALAGVFFSSVLGLLIYWQLGHWNDGFLSPEFVPVASAVLAVLLFWAWLVISRAFFLEGFHRAALLNLDKITKLSTPRREENWNMVKDRVREFLESNRGRFKLSKVKHDLKKVRNAYESTSKESRKALSELHDLAL